MNLKNNKNKIIGYCFYCKDPVFKNEPHTKDKENIYHVFCYCQEHNYTDDFGTYTVDEFGEINE